jgi:hypothetical protein
MYWKTIKTLFFVCFFVLFSQNIKAQVSVQTFIDPCTQEVTLFTVPLQGGTTIFFLNKSRFFTAADVSSGVFSSWVNQTYAEYRQTNPCSQQQGQVTQNQITSQIISSTVQSVVGSIMSSAQSSGGNLNAGGNNKKDENKKSNGNSNGTGNNNNGSGSSSQGGENGGQSQGSGGTTGSTGGTNSSQGGSTGTQGGNGTGSNNPPQGGSGSSQPPVGGSGSSGSGTTGGNGSSGSGTTGGSTTGGSTTGGSGTGGNGSSTGSSGGNTGGSGSTTGGGTSGGGTGNNSNNSNGQSGEEVGATTTMNNDAHNDNGSGGGSSGGGKGGGKSGGKSGSTNPLIISSDLTTAQNLNKTFTPILNLSMNRSSMTGLSSVGATAMIWANLNQFALSTKYTKLHYNKKNTIKYIHNVNLTGVYTYGNILGFLGYSGILNAGKWGVTGFNVSAAVSIISEDKSGYYSPSVTAFYTRPFKVGKKLMVSPELYVMSTPLVYSTKEQVTITDRFFSGFLGSGFDYQISKRFKINMNYKANLSTNPDIPILSFFLIGSKVNL